MAFTIHEFLALPLSALVPPPPGCTGCGKPSSRSRCEDCYWKELSDLVEAHPPGHPRLRR